jgi:hypothetical protein
LGVKVEKVDGGTARHIESCHFSARLRSCNKLHERNAVRAHSCCFYLTTLPGDSCDKTDRLHELRENKPA